MSHVEHRILIDACLRNGVPFLWRGPGTMLIEGSGIRAVLEDVGASGADILGLEGFEVENLAIRPRLDLIFDVAAGFGRKPQDVVTSWGADVWVDVTLGLGTEAGPSRR